MFVSAVLTKVMDEERIVSDGICEAGKSAR